ncbi:unnamed protein product [Prorocentrum cordatum]|uniref:Beta-galactosidase n=1 Tax=Prorocentrum cordatum TaxID=2364126 RepID=A0ABN9VD65_9DINO|nr:unnamed protein product [Polarella glacialis]
MTPGVVSEFGFEQMHARVNRYGCDPEGLNRWVFDHLASNSTLRANWYRRDCHFLPQSAYVYSWDDALNRVNRSKRWCKHVLRYSRLAEDLNRYWGSVGYPFRFGDFRAGGTTSKGGCGKMKGRNLTDFSKGLIAEVYKEDMHILAELEQEAEDAAMAAGLVAPSKSRANGKLQYEMVELARGSILVEEFTTSEEFEIEFGVLPSSILSSSFGNILRVTTSSANRGSVGARSPSFGFSRNSTRLMAFMGHHDNHEARCVAEGPAGVLPVGDTSHVKARLKDTVFAVFVNGSLVCSLPGFSRKYAASHSGRLWASDQFDPAAEAQIGNLTYRPLSKDKKVHLRVVMLCARRED